MAATNQNGDDEGCFLVHMDNGQSVNIRTQAGADAFLTGQGAPSCAFIRTNLPLVDQFRQMWKRQDTPATTKRQLQEQMMQIYLVVACVAEKASPEVFDDKVETHDLEMLVDHAQGVFTELIDAETWKLTGVLAKHDQELFECLTPLNKHARFSNLMLASSSRGESLVDVIAKLCAARSKPHMFGAPVAQSLMSVVGNLQLSLQLDGWETRKIFKHLESTGILAQVFRAVSVPPIHPLAVRDIINSLHFLEVLNRCEKVVRKKLQPGAPTGDVLEDVLHGRDGYLPMSRRNQDVMAHLQNLKTSSDMSNSNVDEQSEIHCCRKCNKQAWDLPPGQALMCCSRCKNVYYCSRECQTADWKSHKRTCSQGLTPLKGHQSMLLRFWQEDDIYYDIMTELTTQMRQRELPKREFYVELDFYQPMGQTSSPAQEKKFRIVVTKELLEGSRPAEPDWFHRGSDVYEKNIAGFLNAVRDHYERLTSVHLLCIARFPDNHPGIYRLQIASPQTRQSIVSDEAVDAFARNDDAALERIYGVSHQLEYIRFRKMQDRMQETSLDNNNDDFPGPSASQMAWVMRQAREVVQSYNERLGGLGSDDDEDDDDASQN